MSYFSDKLKNVTALAAIPMILIGCAGDVSKQDAGTLIGGATGALVGSQFGHGSGRIVGAGIGGVAGALVGSQVGKSMDRQDAAIRHHEDRRYYEDRYYYDDRRYYDGRRY